MGKNQLLVDVVIDHQNNISDAITDMYDTISCRFVKIYEKWRDKIVAKKGEAYFDALYRFTSISYIKLCRSEVYERNLFVQFEGTYESPEVRDDAEGSEYEKDIHKLLDKFDELVNLLNNETWTITYFDFFTEEDATLINLDKH